ncbi:MAG: cytochrome c biogenesis protein CcsA, partial [Thermoplasmata archaeon]|nr:cytochrome c biogenesis protein CcsA [Thermoplasmata archaeon]
MVHDLSSTMLYIHPPLAIMGYVLVVLAFLSTWLSRWEKPWAKRAELLALYAWLFTFLGLVSGMIWAQLAWGR